MRLRKTRRKVGAELNIAPLIDVVFLIIIFCMTVTQFTKVGAENVELPRAQTGEILRHPTDGRLVINVVRDGTIVSRRQEQTPDSLRELLAEHAHRYSANQLTVVIRTDRQAPWGKVQNVMKACDELGISRIKMAVLDPDAPQ